MKSNLAPSLEPGEYPAYEYEASEKEITFESGYETPVFEKIKAPMFLDGILDDLLGEQERTCLQCSGCHGCR